MLNTWAYRQKEITMLPSRHPSQQPRVPVLSSAGMPLMPCRPVRARRLINEGKAAAKWRKGFFYIQMTVETGLNTQTTVIGVDPGSKREAFTVKAKHATFLNLQSHARDGKRIQKDLETRANARRARRNRKTPCRPHVSITEVRRATSLPPPKPAGNSNSTLSSTCAPSTRSR